MDAEQVAMRKPRKYQLPEFLSATPLAQADYQRWLHGRAVAHVRRDKKRGNTTATNETYKINSRGGYSVGRARLLHRGTVELVTCWSVFQRGIQGWSKATERRNGAEIADALAKVGRPGKARAEDERREGSGILVRQG